MKNKTKKLQKLSNKIITSVQSVFLENPDEEITMEEFALVVSSSFGAIVSDMDKVFGTKGVLTVDCVENMMKVLNMANGFRCTPCEFSCDKTVLKLDVSQFE